MAPFLLVLFGARGDLSRRKIIPSLYKLYCKDNVLESFKVIGTGRTKVSTDDFKNTIVDSIKSLDSLDQSKKNIELFVENFTYCSGSFDGCDCDEKFLIELQNMLVDKKTKPLNVIFYFSTPPNAAKTIIDSLKKQDLFKIYPDIKVVIEKPFATDLAGAIELNQILHKCLPEKQIYRMDHYLAKDTVQNILFFRFANRIFEPIWNKDHIEKIQINVFESDGVESRLPFYDKTGVVRDVVQNHIMQLLALIAMDAPVGFDADQIRDARVNVFKAVNRFDSNDDFVLGQYKGYGAHSDTPTFFHGKFTINNERWEGVPFWITTGKKLKSKCSEIVIDFKSPKLEMFETGCLASNVNRIVFSIEPKEKIRLELCVKTPGFTNKPHLTSMDMDYQEMFKLDTVSAYEKILIDCISNELTLFARQDGIEQMWEISESILRNVDKNKMLYYDQNICASEVIQLIGEGNEII